MDEHVVSADALRRQMGLIFSAWGMPADHVKTTVHVMSETDLRGIDSHGIGMIPSYDRWLRQKRLTMAADIRIVRDMPAGGLIDGGAAVPPAPFVRCRTCCRWPTRAGIAGAVGVVLSR